jgi:hypothetical protein
MSLRGLSCASGLALWALATLAPCGWAQSGDERYADYFGCWNCHGRSGEGGEGRPLRDTDLPLPFFLKELRLPATTMPPFSPLLATDAELTLVYEWLGGGDPVAVPMPLSLTLRGPRELSAGAMAELSVTASHGAGGGAATAAGASFRYRLTLFQQDASLVGGQSLEWREPGRATDIVTTDPYGEAWLGPEGGSTLGEIREAQQPAHLATALPEGRYVLVLEAIAADATVLGTATAVLVVE